jgi:hypothetical protein
MGWAAGAPTFIIDRLLHPIILDIMSITATITTEDHRAYANSPGPVALPRPTVTMAMAASSLRPLGAATPSSDDSGARTSTIILTTVVTIADCSIIMIICSVNRPLLIYLVGASSKVNRHWLCDLTLALIKTLGAVAAMDPKRMGRTAVGKVNHTTIISLAYALGKKAKVNRRRL